MFSTIQPYVAENTWIFNNNNYAPITSSGYGAPSYDMIPWIKPSGIKMVSIFCIGPGGAGGLGLSGTNIARPGGGGGGSGGTFRITYPAKILTDTLWVYQSPGNWPTNLRNGSSVGTPDNTVVYDDDGNIIALAKGGGNGGDAVGVSIGTAGVGGTAPVQGTDFWFPQFGVSLSYAGQNGAVGGSSAGAAGGGFTTAWNAGTTLTGGSGGGGLASTNATAGTGGAITSTTFTAYSIPAATAGSNGRDGFFNMTGIAPMSGMGGGGGAATNVSPFIGGNGGNGGIGCGGGGSPGTAIGTNNYAWPGNGGPGMVIISCW